MIAFGAWLASRDKSMFQLPCKFFSITMAKTVPHFACVDTLAERGAE